VNTAKQQLPREFELIARYFRRPVVDPAVLIGSGDDAALVMPSGSVALSTDTLVTGVHFLDTIAPERLGWRALAVNLSDMAAMGARPRWFTLALTLPHSNPDWLNSFAEGLYACAESFDISLIGGDVTAGPLCLSVHIAGEVAGTDVLKRAGAQPGDGIFVTGSIGDAAAGLQIATSETAATPDARFLLDRYEIPTPRIEAGLALRGLASAAIDISDGLVADLGRLCAASACGARIDVAHLPLSKALQSYVVEKSAREFALCGGDDYELCFTAPKAATAQLAVVFESLSVEVTQIGECVSGERIDCHLNRKPFPVPEKGYEHFR